MWKVTTDTNCAGPQDTIGAKGVPFVVTHDASHHPLPRSLDQANIPYKLIFHWQNHRLHQVRFRILKVMSFATRLTNVFIIGKGNKPYISLPKGKAC
ncbi:40S ribosomal protein S4 [Lucilia cuprina]|nr:40S ribosomal protein S4 [Lucilia cuprina]